MAFSTNTKYNSVIEIVETPKGKFIDKTLRISMARAEAEEIRQQVLLQRHTYDVLHIPSSKLNDIDVVPFNDGYSIKIREVFAGLDFMDVVDNDNYSMYLDKLLNDVYKPLLKSTKNTHLTVGIDAILRNFVYNNRRGEFCYVDFMPPKVFYKGKFTQEIPECPDLDFFNVRVLGHNDRAGVVYVTFINLVREFPGQLGLTAAKIQQFLAEISAKKLFKYIEESPIYRATDPKQVQSALENLKDWHGSNYYLIREIANWLNANNPALEPVKREIYALTSQERDPKSAEYGRVSNANFLAAKKLISKSLKKCLPS